MRTRVIPVLAALLFLGACGDDGEKITKADDTLVQATGEDVTVEPAFCEQLNDSDGGGEEFLAVVPKQFTEAAEAIVAFTATLDGLDSESDGGGGNEGGSANSVTFAELADMLSTGDRSESLASLAEFAENECGPTEGSAAISMLSGVALMVRADADEDYCTALRTSFSDAAGQSDSLSTLPSDVELAALQALAPPEHADALGLLSKLGDGDEALDQMTAMGALLGLGLYAETRCDMAGATSQMLFASAFIGLGQDGSGSDGSGNDDLPAPAEPGPPADPASANAALPAGSGLVFESQAVELDDDGGDPASVIVPTGWEVSSFLGLEFNPPADLGLGVFTSMDFTATCDGMCEAGDWNAKLRSPDGLITAYLDSHDGATERPVAGSAGVVITATDGEAAAMMVRWDDTADRLFQCTVSLDASDADQLDAFVAACEASRPSWIPVA